MADGLLNKASIILTPTGYKAGTLYNVAPVIEPYEDFDFARASVASRVNSSGLVEMVGRTLGSELVQNGDFSQLGSELVTCGDFSCADPNDSWDLYETGSSTVTFTDVASINIDGSNSNAGLYQQNIFENSKTYKIVLTMKATAIFDAEILETEGAATRTTIGDVSLTTSYQEFTFYFIGTGNYDLFIHRKFGQTAGQNQQILISNVSVKQVDPNNYWNEGSSWTIADNKATAISNGYLIQSNVIPSSSTDTYKLTYTISNSNDANLKLAGGSNPFGTQNIPDEDGTYTLYVVANGTTARNLQFLSNGFRGDISNVSLKQLIDTNNIPRISYDSNGDNGHILLEPTTTNLYLNTDTLSTQNVSTSASEYSVSFYGTGTITFSGSYSGSLVGTGVNDRVTLTFTATSGTLTSTVSGSVTNAQIENLGYSTSYMPSLSTQGVRATETATGAGSAELINSTEGVLYAEIAALVNGGDDRIISLSDETNNNLIYIRIDNTSNRINCFARGGGGTYNILTVNGVNQTNTNKIALVWDASNVRVWINGSQSLTQSINNTPTGMKTLSFTSPTGGSPFYGKVKAVAVFNEALSDSELTQLTT